MKKRIILGLVAVGVLAFCLPSAYKLGQGTRDVPPDVQKWLTDGSCTHDGKTLVCDFTDAATVKKWSKAMESQVDFWKEQAGQPSAILTKVCRDHGFEDTDCPKILFGMASQESGMGKWMEGDQGRSHGFFHIMYYHNLARSCTDNLKCSASWTLDRMVRLGFATDRNTAIMRHNGTPGIPATVHYLAMVKLKMNKF